MGLIPVEGHANLARDSKTGAIINIDNTEMSLARERKKLRQKKKDEFEDLKDQVQQINNDLSDIKQLLEGLVKQ